MPENIDALNIVPASYELPREIDSAQTFEALVDYNYYRHIDEQKAPGFVIGLSGTDSILTFLVCARAFELAGRPERVVGIHYGEAMPSGEELEKRLASDPDAFWFQKDVIPWLREMAPNSPVIVDSSIDHTMDGMRWGKLIDWSVKDPETGKMRADDDKYWAVGARNLSEQTLHDYSNISKAPSIYPISQLWKSEVLKVCSHLGVPRIALAKSREEDCICGRKQITAVNIEEVDALLMVRKGMLDPRYIKENISSGLLKELEASVERQIREGRHKDRPEYARARVNDYKAIYDTRAYAQAKLAAEYGADISALSKITPVLLKQGPANVAADLVVTNSTNRDLWLPEALTLFGTEGLRSNQRRRMVEKVFDVDNPSIIAVNRVAALSARTGNYGFSFPEWRYVSQRSEGAAPLLEQFGMQRLQRATDVRDATLPPSDPNRDLYGPGFVYQDSEGTIEYRRAYLAISNTSEEKPATIIIRNNSRIFSRERLDAPVYVSFEPLTAEEIQNITPESFAEDGRFIKWQDILKTEHGSDLTDKLRRVEGLMSRLDQFDMSLSNWLQNDGLPNLTAFLESKLATVPEGAKPPLYLAFNDPKSPPWSPETMPLTKETLFQLPDFIKAHEGQGLKFMLLTGPNGDFPLMGNNAVARPATTLRPN